MRKTNAEYQKAYRERWPGREKEASRRCYLRVREFINAAKDKPCDDCGIKYPPYVMDFDHRDPTLKSFEIGVGCRFRRGRLQEEIAKCDVVCSNCHRQRTHETIKKRKGIPPRVTQGKGG